MLNIKERQSFLKEIKLYNGKVDGIEGVKTKGAYLSLQKKYFKRKTDIDGIYGKNTDILLQNVKNFQNSRYFKLEEFKCHCSGFCTGYPHVIDKKLIVNLNKLRNFYGPLFVSSGLRCISYNKNVSGAKSSKHLTGRACDIYKSSINNSFESRKKAILKWLTFDYSSMAYCNGFMKRKNGVTTNFRSSTMNNSIHFEV